MKTNNTFTKEQLETMIIVKQSKNGDYYVNTTIDGQKYRKKSKYVDKVNAYRNTVITSLCGNDQQLQGNIKDKLEQQIKISQRQNGAYCIRFTYQGALYRKESNKLDKIKSYKKDLIAKLSIEEPMLKTLPTGKKLINRRKTNKQRDIVASFSAN